MRLEYKYLLKNYLLHEVRQKIAPYVTTDEYSENGDIREYTVRSIYFDTTNLKYYHEKIDGLKIRKKVRVRGYNQLGENEPVFLEIKRKNENFIGKNRSKLKYENLEDLLITGDFKTYIDSDFRTEICHEDAEKFLHHIYKRSLKPTVLVVYEREAYYSKFDPSLRITFDKNLRFKTFPDLENLFDENELNSAISKYFVMELKFQNGFPSWLQQIIREYNLIRQALSKYTICLDSDQLLKPMHRRSTLSFSNPRSN